MPVLRVHKSYGLSPVQALERLRAKEPSLAGEKLAYAGRLDPLAEGLLLVLAGDSVREAQALCALEKSYELEVLFGARTDSYDLLGLAERAPLREPPEGAPLEQALEALRGARPQPYPPFSSARVRGRPLFYWARRGQAAWALAQREAPVRTVFEARETGRRALTTRELRAAVERALGAVEGDFRQAEVAAGWEALLAREEEGARWDALTLEVRCSSGTYMRSLAHELGGLFGGGAVALRIVRTTVGPFTLAGAVSV